MPKKIIYLDVAATTQVYPSVVNEMSKILKENYGNPSSLHALGENASTIMNGAREKIAKEIACKPSEIIFTSGATESNNIAIQGAAKASKRKKILISSIEHPSVSEVCNSLKTWGYEIVKIPVNNVGLADLKFIEKNIDKNTLLISVMHVNNEIGTKQDIASIGKICKEKGVLFHTDAVQSFGKLNIDVNKMNIDLLSASAHKIGGSKGIGFLYVRSGVHLIPLFYGGGQEGGIRSGTENVHAIAGFAKAIEIQKRVNKTKIKKLRDRLMDGLIKIGGKVNGDIREKRIYNNLNVSFPNVNGEQLVIYLSQKRIMCSTGSACSSKKQAESATLKAIGLTKKEIEGSIRFTLDERITHKDIDYVLKEVRNAVNKLYI